MPDPHTLTGMEAAARAHRRRDHARGEASPFSATTTSTAPPPRRCCAAICGIAGSIRSSISPTASSRAMGRTSTRSARFAEKGAKLLVTVDCGTTSLEPLAEAAKLGLDTVVIDHHQADEELPAAAAIVNPNRADDLSGLGHLAAVGLVFLTLVAVSRELRRRNFWSGTRAEPDLLSLLHLVALGTVADVVPLIGLNRAFVSKGLIALQAARACRRDRADGRVAAVRPAGALASRLPARPAHQCRRPHRPRRSRRAAAAGGGRRRKPRASPPNSTGSITSAAPSSRRRWSRRKPRRMAALGLEEKGAVVVTAQAGLARRRGRAGGGAAEGALRPAGVCHCARAGRRHGHRLGPLDRRRRSRPRGAPGGARGPAGQGRRPCHGGRRHAAQGRARRRSAPFSKTRSARRSKRRGARARSRSTAR